VDIRRPGGFTLHRPPERMVPRKLGKR
jgi:hypothetical protein